MVNKIVIYNRIDCCSDKIDGVKVNIFPVSCHLGWKGSNGKSVLIRFVQVYKKFKTRVGDHYLSKTGYRGISTLKVGS